MAPFIQTIRVLLKNDFHRVKRWSAPDGFARQKTPLRCLRVVKKRSIHRFRVIPLLFAVLLVSFVCACDTSVFHAAGNTSSHTEVYLPDAPDGVLSVHGAVEQISITPYSLRDVRGERVRENEASFSVRYDEEGRESERLYYLPDSTLDLRNVRRYDAGSRRIADVGFAPDGQVLYSNAYAYTAQGREREVVYHVGAGMGERDVYRYDTNGRKVAWFRYEGETLIEKETYAYDEGGRRVEERFYNKAGVLTGVHVKTRNTEGVCVLDRLLDGKGVLLRHTVSTVSNGNVVGRRVYDGAGALEAYFITEYDSKGRVLIEEAYDKNGTRTRKEAFAYDGEGRVVTSSRHEQERLVERVEYTYAKGRRVREERYHGFGTPFFTKTYAYDRRGNITEIRVERENVALRVYEIVYLYR